MQLRVQRGIVNAQHDIVYFNVIIHIVHSYFYFQIGLACVRKSTSPQSPKTVFGLFQNRQVRNGVDRIIINIVAMIDFYIHIYSVLSFGYLTHSLIKAQYHILKELVLSVKAHLYNRSAVKSPLRICSYPATC